MSCCRSSFTSNLASFRVAERLPHPLFTDALADGLFRFCGEVLNCGAVLMKSFHHRAAFERATVRLVIDPDLANVRRSGTTLLFPAVNEDGTPVSVAIDTSAWASLASDYPRSAIAELEQLALSGAWEPFRGGQVWRVILI